LVISAVLTIFTTFFGRAALVDLFHDVEKFDYFPTFGYPADFGSFLGLAAEALSKGLSFHPRPEVALVS
jgi:hypothetical protein